MDQKKFLDIHGLAIFKTILKGYIDTELNKKLSLTGGALTGPVKLSPRETIWTNVDSPEDSACFNLPAPVQSGTFRMFLNARTKSNKFWSIGQVLDEDFYICYRPKNGIPTNYIHFTPTSVRFSNLIEGNLKGNAETAVRLTGGFSLFIGNTYRRILGHQDIVYSLTDIGAAPISHASTKAEYGSGSYQNYGHLRLLTSSHLGEMQHFDNDVAISPMAVLNFVNSKIAALIGNAPAELDTLKEIADFLKDNTIAGGLIQQLNTKVSKAGDVMTGTLSLPSLIIGTSTFNTSKFEVITNAIHIRNEAAKMSFILGDAASCEKFRGKYLLDFVNIASYNNTIDISSPCVKFSMRSGNNVKTPLIVNYDHVQGVFRGTFDGNATSASKLNKAFTLIIGDEARQIDGTQTIQFPAVVPRDLTVNTLTSSVVTTKYLLRSIDSWQELDLKDKDPNTWYPVSFRTGIRVFSRLTIIIEAELDGVNKGLSWANHPNGFFCYFSETINAALCANQPFNRVIHENSFLHIKDGKNPIGQVTNTYKDSSEIIWLRGGAKYRYQLSDPTNITVTINNQFYQDAFVAADKYYATTTPKGLETSCFDVVADDYPDTFSSVKNLTVRNVVAKSLIKLGSEKQRAYLKVDAGALNMFISSYEYAEGIKLSLLKDKFICDRLSYEKGLHFTGENIDTPLNDRGVLLIEDGTSFITKVKFIQPYFSGMISLNLSSSISFLYVLPEKLGLALERASSYDDYQVLHSLNPFYAKYYQDANIFYLKLGRGFLQYVQGVDAGYTEVFNKWISTLRINYSSYSSIQYVEFIITVSGPIQNLYLISI